MIKKTILVTGGAGFIGSNFISYFLRKYLKYRVVNLDKLTYAGDLKNLEEVKHNPNYVFVKGNICNVKLVNEIFKKYDVRGVIHFAAESHVDRSILGPSPFIKTNIEGTFVLLEAAKNYWLEDPFKYKEEYKNCRFHHVSSDEVYGSLLENEESFKETTPYAPNSLYSASKASSNFLARAYYRTYGLDVTTSNSSNNYGPNQHIEKLIPTIIRKALSKKPIPIYGDGKNIRDWLYVLDHCKGIDLIFHNGKSGEIYNIGAENERHNLEIATIICDILDKLKPLKCKSYKEFITFVKDRPGHDRRYAVSVTKIEKELGWKAQETFSEGIEETVKFYMRDL